MSKSTSLVKVKEHSKSITHSTVGDIIADYFVKGVPTMMGWIAALAAFLRGLPLWAIILIGSAVFLFLSFAWYLIGARHRTLERDALTESSQEDSDTENAKTVEDLTEQLRLVTGERDALEKARKNASDLYEKARKENEGLQMSLTSHYEREESYKWLHQEAERDKSNLSKYVYIIFRKVNYEGLTELEPYIEIIFNIINASVYNIIIDENIKGGAVYFNDIELNPKMAKLDGSLHSIKRGDDEKRFLVIKQWLSPELANRISNPQPNDELHLERLKLIVRADNSNSEVKEQRLSLPSSIPVTAPALKKDAKQERIRKELEKILEYGYNVSLDGRDTVYEAEVDQYNRWRAKAEGFVRIYRDEADVKRFQQGGLPVLVEFLKDYLD